MKFFTWRLILFLFFGKLATAKSALLTTKSPPANPLPPGLLWGLFSCLKHMQKVLHIANSLELFWLGCPHLAEKGIVVSGHSLDFKPLTFSTSKLLIWHPVFPFQGPNSICPSMSGEYWGVRLPSPYSDLFFWFWRLLPSPISRRDILPQAFSFSLLTLQPLFSAVPLQECPSHVWWWLQFLHCIACHALWAGEQLFSSD